MKVIKMSLEEAMEMLSENFNVEKLEKAMVTEVELKLTISELMDCSIALGNYIISGACAETMDYGYIPTIAKLKDKLDDIIAPVLKEHFIEC